MRNRKFTLKAYTVASITLLVGAFLSINLNDWQWFSRCGSLVVVIGIILTSQQIIQHIHNLDRNRGSVGVQRDWADADKRRLISEDSEQQWLSEKYGLYMLIIGTLVWGFGDLINLM